MANNFLVIPSEEYETLETIKFKVISSTQFKRSWTLLAETLGFVMAPGSQLVDLHVTKKDSNYIIHHKSFPNPSNAKITVSNIDFLFLPETITTGDAKSTELTPDVLASIKLNNNNDSPVKYIRKLTTISSSSTTISSSHKIANSLSVKQSYSTGVPTVFSASLGLNFKFSHEYTFGNQEKVQESTEFTDEVSITLPPENSIPLSLISYKTKTSLPFSALAQMFYRITIEGPFNRSGSAHKTLMTPQSNIPNIMKFSYKFGDDELSAEDSFKKESFKRFIPGITPWDWTLIDSTAGRLDLNFARTIQNGFATKITGKFEKENSKVINIQTGKSY